MSSVTEILMLLGTVQGLVLALAVLGRRRARSFTANRVLALFLALVSVRLGDVLLTVSGWVEPRGLDFTLPLPFTYSPLLWLYVRALTEPRFAVTPRLALHAVPAVAVGALVALAPRWLAAPPSVADPVDVAWTVLALGYVGAILRRLRAHRRRVEDLGSSERLRLDWVRGLTVGYAVVLGLMLVYVASFAVGRPLPPGSNRILYAGIAVVVYAWGYLGLRHSAVLSVPPELPLPPAPSVSPGRSLASEPPPELAPELAPELPPVAPLTAAPPSPLPTDDTASLALRARLLHLMEHDKPYLDAELTLHDLAARLDVAPHVLSPVINRGLGQNFFRFVNEYRVAEAKRLLADPAPSKVLTVAFDAGFSAKSSFNRVFRELAGVTPSQYRRAILAGGSRSREEGSTP